MANRLTFIIIASAAIALSACQTTSNAEPAEAMLSSASPQTTAALTKAVSTALGGRKVTLAPNVLTDGSQLVMDPKNVGDRSMERPDHFTLMKQGSSCFLMHKQTSAKVPLKGVKCQAL